MNRSEHRLALSLAEQIEKIGNARNDIAVQLQGRLVNGHIRACLGEFVTARALLEQCCDLGDLEHRVGWGLAVDPYTAVLVHLSAVLALLGYIDQARLRMNEALSEARRLRHAQAQTLAQALLNAIVVGSTTGSTEMQQHAEELSALSNKHGFPLFLGYTTVIRGWSLTALGQAQEGLTLLTSGLAEIRATGTVAGTPLMLMGLAQAYAMLGQSVEGLNCLAEAAQIIATTEERRHEAEMYRIRGDLLNVSKDGDAAKQSYQQAITVAKGQSAKTLELRATTSLARLWRDQGKRGQAYDLLAPLYSWFTEGFETPYLKEAKALLDELT
jgi:predicted ATPase